MMILIMMKVHIDRIHMIIKIINLLIILFHFHESKINKLFTFLRFRRNIITWRYLQYFIHTKIIIHNIFQPRCLLIKLI